MENQSAKDISCEKCPLKFGNRIVLNMHLALVHKMESKALHSEKDVKVDNLVAKKVTESSVRVTCVQAKLEINKFTWDDEGEYSLIAKNRYGFDGDSIVIKIAGGISRRRQRSKEKDRPSSRKRDSEHMNLPQINSSVSMRFKSYSIATFISFSMSIYHIMSVSYFHLSS